jgi:uncharacterized protein YggE
VHSLALALLFLFLQRPDATPAPSVIIVSGNAQLLVAPDEATVRLGVVRQAPAAQTAQEQANAAVQEILSNIGKAGVPANQIQTARLVLTPVYAPRNSDSRDAPRIVAYNATNSVSVRLNNLSLVGGVIDAGLKAGANQLEGVQFGLRNDTASREEALKQAVQEARSKAQVMADALRVNLVEVLEASEGGVSVVPFAEGGASPRVAFSASSAETPVSPGQIQVHANVTIRYRISPR